MEKITIKPQPKDLATVLDLLGQDYDTRMKSDLKFRACTARIENEAEKLGNLKVVNWAKEKRKMFYDSAYQYGVNPYVLDLSS